MATAPDLRVVDDVAAGAVEVFLDEAPRIVLLTGGETARTFYERLAKLEQIRQVERRR